MSAVTKDTPFFLDGILAVLSKLLLPLPKKKKEEEEEKKVSSS